MRHANLRAGLAAAIVFFVVAAVAWWRVQVDTQRNVEVRAVTEYALDTAIADYRQGRD